MFAVAHLRLATRFPPTRATWQRHTSLLDAVLPLVSTRLYLNLQAAQYHTISDLLESLHKFYGYVSRHSHSVPTFIVFSLPDEPVPNAAAEIERLDVVFNEEDDDVDDIKQQRLAMGLALPEFRHVLPRVDSADETDASESDSSLPPQKTMTRYGHVAVGGTFDHLHAGHKLLLSATVALATNKITIGLTDESLCSQKKFKAFLQPYETRRQEVEQFIELLNPNIDLDICPLMDPLGPAATDPTIEALVVSKETAGGIKAANRARQKNDISELQGVIVPLIEDSRGKSKISSTMLRQKAAERKESVGDARNAN